MLKTSRLSLNLESICFFQTTRVKSSVFHLDLSFPNISLPVFGFLLFFSWLLGKAWNIETMRFHYKHCIKQKILPSSAYVKSNYAKGTRFELEIYLSQPISYQTSYQLQTKTSNFYHNYWLLRNIELLLCM